MNIVISWAIAGIAFLGTRDAGGQDMNPLAFNLQTRHSRGGGGFLFADPGGRRESGPPTAFIGDTEMGRCGQDQLEVPEETLLFVGADGHRHCGSYYKRLLA